MERIRDGGWDGNKHDAYGARAREGGGVGGREGTCMTPGMMGRSGKCPVNWGSLAVMHCGAKSVRATGGGMNG